MLENPLENITRLNGVSYRWKVDEFPDRYFTEGAEIGFTAQELEEVYPEFVHTDDDGHKYVSHDKITAIFVEAIKELKSENNTINDRIVTLENKYEELLSKGGCVMPIVISAGSFNRAYTWASSWELCESDKKSGFARFCLNI